MTREELEREAARVCRAFDAPNVSETKIGPNSTAFLVCNEKGEGVLGFELDGITGELLRLFSRIEDFCSISASPHNGARSPWRCKPAPDGSPDNEAMARGLYRLAFDDEQILSQLPQVSGHEKLELRLTMPLEFWPKTWLDEESGLSGLS